MLIIPGRGTSGLIDQANNACTTREGARGVRRVVWKVTRRYDPGYHRRVLCRSLQGYHHRAVFRAGFHPGYPRRALFRLLQLRQRRDARQIARENAAVAEPAAAAASSATPAAQETGEERHSQQRDDEARRGGSATGVPSGLGEASEGKGGRRRVSIQEARRRTSR